MIDNAFNKNQYSQNVAQYLESNVEGKIGGGSPQSRVALLKKFLPVGRRIMEIGSGGGEDALELQKSGYKVTASDFVDEFVSVLKQKGLNAILFNAKKDSFPEIDALYINAVFVHFIPDEVVDCLKRAKISLQNEKVIFVSVLKGDGFERSARGRGFERDFYYYTLPTLKALLYQEGFEVAYINDEDSKWLQVIAVVK